MEVPGAKESAGPWLLRDKGVVFIPTGEVDIENTGVEVRLGLGRPEHSHVLGQIGPGSLHDRRNNGIAHIESIQPGNIAEANDVGIQIEGLLGDSMQEVAYQESIVGCV